MKNIALACAAAVFATLFSAASPPARAQSTRTAAKPQPKPRVDAKKAAPAASDNPQAAAKGDKIMSIDELRACMTTKKVNDDEASALKREQADFARAQDAVRAEQNEVKKSNDELLTRAAVLRSEQAAMMSRVDELRLIALEAKTDADKAQYEQERDRLAERNRLHDLAIVNFNAAQQAQATRIEALNARIGPLNERGKAVSDRVEPVQEKVVAWRAQCGNRRYREEDEIAIKKELAAAIK